MKTSTTTLKEKHKGEDIWVVAAGPSMNHVHPSFFEGKTTIGVNRVGKRFNCTYIVSKDAVGYKEVADNIKNSALIMSKYERGDPGTVLNDVPYDFYYFDHPAKPNQAPDLSVIGTDQIVVSFSTITSALHLACYMGAKNIIICGHDCGVIDMEAAFKGYYTKDLKPHQVTAEGYARFVSNDIEQHTIALKKVLQTAYDVNIHSLNPFINFGLEGHTYEKIS